MTYNSTKSFDREMKNAGKKSKMLALEKSKRMIAIMLEINADGTDKLKPIVTERAAKPRFF